MVVLRGTSHEIWPQLAYSCAALKFALLFAALCYSLPWLLMSLFGWCDNLCSRFTDSLKA
jgi:hypothetical protein